MNQEIYRKLMTCLSSFAKVLQQDLDLSKYPDMELDRTMIFYKVKEISGFLQDMQRIVDAVEHPDKLHAEFTPRDNGNRERTVEPL